MIFRRFLRNYRNATQHLKPSPNHAFKRESRRHWLRSPFPPRRLVLPAAFANYEYSIEQGLKPRHFLARLLIGSFHSKLLVITALAMLPLAWWLDYASIFQVLEDPQTSTLQSEVLKVKKLALPTLSHIANTKISATSWLPVAVNSGDNLTTIFERHGFNKDDLRQILQLKEFSPKLSKLHPSQTINIKYDRQKNIEELFLIFDFAEKLHIFRTASGFAGRINDPVHPQIVPAVVDVTASLFEDGQKAGLSKELISQLVGICRWDIDFQPVDHFSVIYQQYYFEGKIKEGDILALKLVAQDDSVCEAVRYHSAYYKPNGQPLHNTIGKVTTISEAAAKTSAFLNPVSFTKISSDYGMREHPILGKMLFHKGVDYAAPKGTPVIAVANATIKFMGYQKGYGKTIILQHDQHHDTLYAHLSNYAEELTEGKTVIQADIIGYVGQTGATTGPHLHYEHRIDGEPQNPLEIGSNESVIVQVDQQKEADFFKQTQPLLAQLIQLEEDHQRHPTLASQQMASTKVLKPGVK